MRQLVRPFAAAGIILLALSAMSEAVVTAKPGKEKPQTAASADERTTSRPAPSDRIPQALLKRPVSPSLLRLRWEQWRRMSHEQRRRIVERWRGLLRTDPRRREEIIRAKEQLDKQDEATLQRLRELQKRYEEFVASLTVQERKRLLAMTPKERAREVARILAERRLKAARKAEEARSDRAPVHPKRRRR